MNKDQLDKKTGWVVWVNVDSTEGRGQSVPRVTCETEATASRFAKGKGVQGSDATIKETDLYLIDYQWYGPVIIEPSTNIDDVAQENINAYREALKKAESLGLTDDEISLLRKG